MVARAPLALWRVTAIRRSTQKAFARAVPAGVRLPVRWRSGSVRRADVLILEWSFWPWQRLMIRPDSLSSAEDYRRLTAALYNDLH